MGGFLTENGPFILSADGAQLLLREFRWTRFTNMLWIESPVGVGFSYSTVGDYNTGDFQTSRESLLALEDFFSKFPEYKTNSLHLAGESYAGGKSTSRFFDWAMQIVCGCLLFIYCWTA